MKLNRKSWRSLVRGLLSLSVLLGICAMCFPLPFAPLPQKSQEKDSSQPFPCQNRPCGCRSAEQCWKKCCCFDNNQKTAWAKANNVKVPDFVLVASKKENEDAGREICSTPVSLQRKPSVPRSAGCSEHSAKKWLVAGRPSCCKKAVDSRGDASVVANLGSDDSCKASAMDSPEIKSRPSKPAKSRWVLAIYAAECQGQGPVTVCFPTSVIPERIALVIQSVDMIEILSFVSERLHQASLRPPLPPPKILWVR